MSTNARLNKFIEDSITAGTELTIKAHVGADVKLVLNDLLAIVRQYRDELHSGSQADTRLAKQKASASVKKLDDIRKTVVMSLTESVTKVRQMNEMFPEKNLNKDIIKILQDLIETVGLT